MQFGNIISMIIARQNKIGKIKFKIENKYFRVYVPNDELWGAVKDILLNREYEYLPEFELKKFKNNFIVDAGAHVGLFSLVSSVFANKILAIEPHPFNYFLLKKNVIKNSVKNIEILNRALVSDKAPKVRIYTGNHTGGVVYNN